MGHVGAAVASPPAGWAAADHGLAGGDEHALVPEPHDLLPKSTAYEDSAAWRESGVWQEILDVLRGGVCRGGQSGTRSQRGQHRLADGQDDRTGRRARRRRRQENTGRKRPIAVDTLSLLLAVVVTSAAVDDAAAAPQVFEQLTRREHPRLEVVWGDAKYHNHALSAWLARHRSIDWRLDVVRRPREAQGFTLLPKRWAAATA
ncbi:MAG: transposase [Planctomycetaceae bacterium]|nr:transposase [Planctomycetaceae bacterium]